MHVPKNLKSPNNISKWQMGINSAFQGLKKVTIYNFYLKESYVNVSCAIREVSDCGMSGLIKKS
jgi:hypothetical protein